jgi:glycosyltransferase involved in cell wall biosynthesis
LNVASVSKLKNPKSFIKIAERVCTEHTEAKFIWLGGKASNALSDYIKHVGLERNVEFVDFDPNPYGYMQRASLLLLTSKEEAFGLVLAEAMACSRTTLCFAGTGAAEVAGDTGYVVPQGDVIKACDIILTVLQRSPEERVNRAARERYEQLYSPEAYVRRLEPIIRNSVLMKGHRS